MRFLRDVARLPQITDNRCTLNVGRIAGGAATNIVAERCGVRWEYRADRNQDADMIKIMISEYLEGEVFAALDVANKIELDVPQFHSAISEKWMRVLTDCGAQLPVTTLPFGSEAGIFERSRIPSVVCGPGSIDQAHRVDEWIACAALEEADRFLSKVGAWACQTEPD